MRANLRNFHPENFLHGTRSRYTAGCHCEPCTTANRIWSRNRRKAIIFHGPDPLVPIKTAQKHILMLSKLGVGRTPLHDASGVSINTLARVRRGEKKLIRRSTERKILAVDKHATADHALISAGQTWRYINQLLSDGFTKKELARRLGIGESLQIRKDRITALTATRVERFYRAIMLGADDKETSEVRCS